MTPGPKTLTEFGDITTKKSRASLHLKSLIGKSEKRISLNLFNTPRETKS